MAKSQMSKRLASLTFTEKISILEKLRDRSVAVSAAGLRRKHEECHQEGHVCECLGWQPCGCGNQPPYHCLYCCRELTAEQIAAAKKRGFYPKEQE